MFTPSKGPAGEVRQSALPLSNKQYGAQANGLLLRGVVLKSYVFDQDGLPVIPSTGLAPTSVYCDVLVYSSIPGARFAVFPRCAVTQSHAGLHDGDVWIPRATTMDISGEALNQNTTTNPANMDGDHVLLGFCDNDLGQPVVLRSIPHPRTDVGPSLPLPIDVPGHRVRVVSEDGQPRIARHHGSFWGVNADGDFLVDTTKAHNGELNDDGTEPTPSNNGSNGNIRVRLPQGSSARIEVISDSSNPDVASNKLCELIIEGNQVRVRIGNNDNLTLQDGAGNAMLQLGDGAVHVALAEHLATLWNQLKASLDAFDAGHATQLCGVGPVTPPPPVAAPAWNSAIESTKLSLPDG